MPEVITIETAATQLAEVIKHSDEWKSFHEINHEFESNVSLNELLNQYRTIVGELQASQNQDPTHPDIRRLEQLQIKIQQDPIFQRREQSADQMLAVLAQANTALTLSLGMDFAVNAQQPESRSCCSTEEGGGGGGGCGCH